MATFSTEDRAISTKTVWFRTLRKVGHEGGRAGGGTGRAAETGVDVIHEWLMVVDRKEGWW